MLSNLSLSAWILSKPFNLSLSSILFFSIRRSLVFKSSTSRLRAVALPAALAGEPLPRDDAGETLYLSMPAVRDTLGLISGDRAFGSSLSTEEAGSSLRVSLTVEPFARLPLNWLKVGLWIPGRTPGRGASGALAPVVFAAAIPGLLPAAVFVANEFLDVRVGGGGGPIEVGLFPPVVGLDLAIVVEAGLAPGVEVRGVDAPEVADDPSCFVGDFVGDCRSFQ